MWPARTTGPPAGGGARAPAHTLDPKIAGVGRRRTSRGLDIGTVYRPGIGSWARFRKKHAAPRHRALPTPSRAVFLTPVLSRRGARRIGDPVRAQHGRDGPRLRLGNTCACERPYRSGPPIGSEILWSVKCKRLRSDCRQHNAAIGVTAYRAKDRTDHDLIK